MTKKGTVYGDLFRYAPGGSVRSEVWKERMESEFDSYPEVKNFEFYKLLFEFDKMHIKRINMI